MKVVSEWIVLPEPLINPSTSELLLSDSQTNCHHHSEVHHRVRISNRAHESTLSVLQGRPLPVVATHWMTSGRICLRSIRLSGSQPGEARADGLMRLQAT